MAKIKDIVLIHLEDEPVSFARVESILPDPKKDWYQIKLLMLQIPIQVVTWILKDEYINGANFFMNGKKMRLETVECPGEEFNAPQALKEKRPEKQEAAKENRPPAGNIISFSDIKNSKPGPEPEIG